MKNRIDISVERHFMSTLKEAEAFVEKAKAEFGAAYPKMKLEVSIGETSEGHYVKVEGSMKFDDAIDG